MPAPKAAAAPVPAPKAAAPVPAPKAAAPKPAPAPRPAPAKADVARVAREIWEERRRPVGQDFEIWLEAERRLAK